MKVQYKIAAAVAAAGVVAALPGAADAAKIRTKTVYMGLPSQKAGKKFQSVGADVNDFFPHGITVHVGDRVRFVPTGFHTLDFAPRGQGPIALVSTKNPIVTNALDAAGQPFWFNNAVPNASFNPVLLKSRFGKKLRYGGKNRVESGLPLANKPKPLTVKFTRTGNFTYFCDIHPGMKGVVHVRKRGTRIPKAKDDKRAINNQLNRDFNVSKGLKAAKPGALTVDVGVAGPNGEEYYGFAPGTVSVKVGQTLKFQMTKGSFETHTATTGPDDPNKPGTYLGTISSSFQGAPVIDPRGVYPSEAPGTIATLTPTLHGNGFWNSGALDNDSASPQPSSNSVTFGAAGTYQFWCMVHPFMHLTVTVSP